jgi:glycosyltransferase involved in cell wall biosynthesis
MRIVIDMQGAQTESRFRGIGRYSLSFAQAIVRNRGEHEIFLALSGLFPDTIEPIRAAFDGLLPQENIRVWHVPGQLAEENPGNDARREVAELIREAFLASLLPDVIHISSLFEGYVDDAVTSIGRFDRVTPVSVSLYDLIPLLNPEHYLDSNPRYAQYYRRKVEHLMRAASHLAISEFTRQEGLSHLDVPASRIVNVATAIESCFCPLHIDDATAVQLRQKFGMYRPFILYTGGADERKNLPRLIQAYAVLPAQLRAGHQLLLAGRMPEGNIAEFKHLAKSAGLKPDELCFTGYVTDEELIQLYNLCELFVFPSWHEGFGLPALEAMASGAPVISANTSSLPEVIGLEAALFDPLDVNAIATKMIQVLKDGAFRATLREHGLQQAKRFSWDESAKRAIESFEVLHSRCVGDLQADEPEKILPKLIQTIAAAVPPKISDGELLNIAHALGRIQAGKNQRQLLVDISELVQRDSATGIQRVTRSILKELLASPPDGYEVVPVYATQDNLGYRYARHFTARFCGVASDIVDEPIDYRTGDIFLGLDLQHHIVAVQKNYLATLRRDGVKVYFVVYDLLPVLMPHVFLPGADVNHKAWLETLTGFDGAICISRAVADELTAWQRIHGPQRLRPFTIDYFHLGGDVNNSVPSLGVPDDANQVLHGFALRPTFLMVGTIEPRKGLAQTLGAFELLWNEGVDVNLVIVGKQGWLVDSLVRKIRRHSELGKRLFWLEGISDEYLEKVYASSTCLIAASEGEGFGLPLIEAAQHKLPIIARDIPVFCEVVGEHAYYFQGFMMNDLATAIQAWLSIYATDTHPKPEEMHWQTWAQSSRQLVARLIPEKISKK